MLLPTIATFRCFVTVATMFTFTTNDGRTHLLSTVLLPWPYLLHLKHRLGDGVYSLTMQRVDPIATSCGKKQASNVTMKIDVLSGTPDTFLLMLYTSATLWLFNSLAMSSSEYLG